MPDCGEDDISLKTISGSGELAEKATQRLCCQFMIHGLSRAIQPFVTNDPKVFDRPEEFVLCIEGSIEDKKKKNGSDMVDRSSGQEGGQQQSHSCCRCCHKQNGSDNG
ncbi:hypothetical protein L2E82_51052 [Cichorium intybus]|nr:hypothetical protein L2E82_51052 [Cichorium intybus]